MKFALCNEMFGDRPFADVCSVVKQMGYHGLEIAPFTIAQIASDISIDQRKEIRGIIKDHGLETVGLHWLFVGPKDLHITTMDNIIWNRTKDYMNILIELCYDLGGKVMVIGSPNQRSVSAGHSPEIAWRRASQLFSSVLDHASNAGVTLCIEPLSLIETNFINSVEQGMQMVRQIDHPNFKIHLDIKAMSSEKYPVPNIIRSVHVEDIGHFHVNDPNLYGPGMGEVDYGPIAEAVDEIGWDKWLSVEVFKYDPDPETIAQKSIDYLIQFWNDK